MIILYDCAVHTKFLHVSNMPINIPITDFQGDFEVAAPVGTSLCVIGAVL